MGVKFTFSRDLAPFSPEVVLCIDPPPCGTLSCEPSNFIVASKCAFCGKLCEELRLPYQALILRSVKLRARHSSWWEVWHKGLSGSQATLAAPDIISHSQLRAPLYKGNSWLLGFYLATYRRQGLVGNPSRIGFNFEAQNLNSSFLALVECLLAGVYRSFPSEIV